MDLFTIAIGLVAFILLAMYFYLAQTKGIVESFGIPYEKPFLFFGSPPFAYHKLIYHKWLKTTFKKHGKTWARYDIDIDSNLWLIHGCHCQV